MRYFYALLCVALICAAVVAVSTIWNQSWFRDVDRPDPEFLAHDLHFMLAGHRIMIPAVALAGGGSFPIRLGSESFTSIHTRNHETNKYKFAVLEKAGDPDNPLQVNRLRVSLHRYETHGESGLSQDVCPRLSQDWSFSACLGELRQARPDLPQSFELVTDGLLAGRLEKASLLEFALVETAEVSGIQGILCPDNGNSCSAVFPMAAGVFASTYLSCSDHSDSDCLLSIRNRSRAIYDFVTRDMSVF